MENQNMGKGGSRSIGPVIGLIVIIAIILLGGIYFWSMRSGNGGNDYSTANQQNNSAGGSNTTATINTSVPTSYNSAAVEKALNESDPNQIDTSGL